MDNNPLYTDHLEELWIRALEGDADAFRDIHRVLFKGLYNYALKLLQDSDLPNDAVQDLFVKIWVRQFNGKNFSTTLNGYAVGTYVW